MGLATARVLTLTDRVELAGALLEDAIADAGTRGSVLTFATASAFRSELAYRLGALAKAGADAQAALQIAAEHEWQLGLPACAAYVIDTLIERDELVAAADILRRHRLDDALPLLITCNLLLDSRGRLRIASGEVRDGLADLLECGRRMHDWGDCSPSHWRCGAALALLTLGDKQQARRLADEEFEYARAFGTPRAVGIALRVRGLVIGGDEGLELLQQAVRALADSCARLEHARALTDLGAALRRNGQRRAARDHLRLGLDLAHRCGATVVAGRAHDELTVSGARPRRRRLSGRDSLTPSEHRVAAMASAAMSNRDIAQALFVTVRTIETHLSHVYGKLDVHSREELAGALACEDADAANDDSLPDAAARAKHP
jgi:DNA-binding CsgD family transcriptional regulator